MNSNQNTPVFDNCSTVTGIYLDLKNVCHFLLVSVVRKITQGYVFNFANIFSRVNQNSDREPVV